MSSFPSVSLGATEYSGEEPGIVHIKICFQGFLKMSS